MPDGVRLAVDAWLPSSCTPGSLPALVRFTRYWRSYELSRDILQEQPLYTYAQAVIEAGYALVVVDCRGSGASYGTRLMEYSRQEIEDTGVVIDWIAGQSWCNGKVAAIGTSYSANLALMAAGVAPQALRVVAPVSADFEAYSQLMSPGGVPNTWIKGTFSGMVAAMDRNDYQAILKFRPEKPGSYLSAILGVRPVDGDQDHTLLSAAVGEHAGNYDQSLSQLDISFRDAFISPESTLQPASLCNHQSAIQASGIPIYYRTGWLDAGTAEGAIAMFNTFPNPMKIIIGPWNHGLANIADPYEEPLPRPSQETLSEMLKNIHPFLSERVVEDQQEKALYYYTLGERKWKKTSAWPPPGTHTQQFYLSQGNSLSPEKPGIQEGCDRYQVDQNTSTGRFNRWHTQIGTNIILSPDRRDEDQRLIIYQSSVLERDVEITGQPVAHLFVRSTASDGAFFVYLEDVCPDGRVLMITEGCLRALHRKLSDEKPSYWMPDLYHTFLQKDALPLIPGEVTELVINLFPISVLIRQGHRIRLSVAGADKETFALIPDSESPIIYIERNEQNASFIDLPVAAGYLPEPDVFPGSSDPERREL